MTDPSGRFSGGEKARLVLALIVWQRPNLLLLDEPTNHLDLDMRQALTEALMAFEGALVVVSHDRHLLRTTTDELYLVHGGSVEQFDGDLEDYQQWLAEQNKLELQQFRDQQEKDKPAAAATVTAQDRKVQKRREAEFRQLTQPIRKKITELEKLMDKHSNTLSDLETKLSDAAIYEQDKKAELTECLKKQTEHKTALEDVEMEWMELQEQLETMTSEFELN